MTKKRTNEEIEAFRNAVKSYERNMSKYSDALLRNYVVFGTEEQRMAAKIELEFRQELEDYKSKNPMDIIGALRRGW